MSQNKTIIPDFEFDKPGHMYSDLNSNADFYRPSGTLTNSTVIAGMNSEPQNDTYPANPQPIDNGSPNINVIQLQQRVIIGVMFSVSKGLLGEIFPIYLGRNVIGCSKSCDIRLMEKTVSEEHAVLYARSDGYPDECQLTITDYGSSHGTMINQRDCRYETSTVIDNDILTIGRHYKLMIKLFDISNARLFEDNEFEELNSSDDKSAVHPSTNDFYAPSQSGNNDNRTVIG